MIQLSDYAPVVLMLKYIKTHLSVSHMQTPLQIDRKPLTATAW